MDSLPLQCPARQYRTNPLTSGPEFEVSAHLSWSNVNEAAWQ
jgi:hypothetical protein